MQACRPLLALLPVSALLCACGPTPQRQATSAGDRTATLRPTAADQEIRAIAREAYVYAVPLLASYQTLHAVSIDTGTPQFNTLHNTARVLTPADTAWVTPNADTPGSFAGLDLRAEPVVISVPPMAADRYFVLQLMDLYTYNFAYIGSRTTGNNGGHFLVAGPGWHGTVPAGITQVIPAETQLVNLVGRTQLFGPDDLDTVQRIQAGYRIQPLSAFTGAPPPPPPAPLQAWPAPLDPARSRSSPVFFEQVAFLLRFAPVQPSETALRTRMARIGIDPASPLVVASLPPATVQALADGMADGQREIDQRRAAMAGRSDTLFGARDVLKNDYVARATGTQVGIGTNSREEALSPVYENDADGAPLDGSRHRYTLRFPPGGLPPVNAFWSLTMYGLPRQLLVANPINRYRINSAMLPDLKRDADGGITLYLQHAPPPADRRHNWLPAPDGPFMATMRYYWPRHTLLDGQWTSPSIERVR
ncbi:DUF1254 domain-containing protein [Stenotrophomonas sp. LGBM10]|uniref:DUF1254 domain-containing protein n=1 Tax=Stenotrophomonas sp. LGBM10 TaxID=3390038 RepID=UPI00398AEA6E